MVYVPRVLVCIVAMLVTSALAQTQFRYSAEQVIARGKRSDVSKLDSRLTAQRFDQWLKSVVGPEAKIRWEANDCGEQAGGPADADRDFPVCAQAEAVLSDGRKVVITIAVGTMKKGFTIEPGGLYYSVVEQGDDVATIKRLGELPEMLRSKAK